MKSEITRRALLRLTAGAAVLSAHAAASGTLALTLVDEDGGATVPARVLLRDARGTDHVPEGAVPLPIGKDKWFLSTGEDLLTLPEGEFDLRVERGTEYVPVKRRIRVFGANTHQRVSLRRWIDMRQRGYVSGENHLHVPASNLPAMLTGGDLDFGSSLYWWNGPDLDHPGGERAIRRMSFGGVRTTASVFDAELEYSWGAVYLVGIERPLETLSDKERANWAYIKEARELGGLVCYQGGWSREVLVDALLGLVDVVNVCNNNFHRYRFQPRSVYSNLLKVNGLPAYMNTPEGMLRMNTGTYYRLLNCGLRLAAGAGSATGVKMSPPGYNRCYVRAERGMSLPEYLGAWRRGRNFVTNGPMIFLTADGSYAPGDSIRLPGDGRTVRLRAAAIAEQPLKSLEIIVNGRVVGKVSVSRETREATLDIEFECTESCWIVAQATEEDGFLDDREIEAYAAGVDADRVAALELPSRLRFGHTSPVYVEVGGKPVRVAESIEEARRMLDAFEEFARETASDAHRAEILERVTEARARL